jgi:predicted metalloprotease
VAVVAAPKEIAMRLENQVSPNIIDRRRLALGAIGGIIATLLALFGVRLATGTTRDADRDLVFVVSTALDRGQTYWAGRFDAKTPYRPAKVVIFEQATGSGCGRALSQAGPFYCPGDERIYLDVGYLRAIRGDLARAYVIYHELGHHVQKLTGAELIGGFSIELAADCLAGEVMRAEMLGGNLSPGDIAAALAEAAAVGDDALRPESPETWTHGTADMRVGAVTAGLSGAGCRL